MTEVGFVPEPISHPALDRLLQAYRAVYEEGTALLGCFGVIGGRLTDWIPASGGAFDLRPLWHTDWAANGHTPRLNTFLQSLPVTTLLKSAPDGHSNGLWGISDRPAFLDPEWQPMSSLTLDGDLATVLFRGGYYRPFKGTAIQAKECCGPACETMLGGHPEDIWVYKSIVPWCGWFFDIHGDNTWVLIDDRNNVLWLLCTTDTD